MEAQLYTISGVQSIKELNLRRFQGRICFDLFIFRFDYQSTVQIDAFHRCIFTPLMYIITRQPRVKYHSYDLMKRYA